MIQSNTLRYKQVVIGFLIYCSIYSTYARADQDTAPTQQSDQQEFIDTNTNEAPSTTQAEPIEEKKQRYELDIDPLDIQLDDTHLFSDAEQPDEELGFDTDNAQQENKSTPRISKPRKIQSILIEGNKFTAHQAIASYIPYKEGEIFDPQKTRQLIHNLYYGLKRFRTIEVKGENIGDDLINLHIVVVEKPILKEVVITGNTQLSETELKKDTDFDLPAIEEGEMKVLAQKIKKLYTDKGYFQTLVDTSLEIDDDGRAIAIFTIHENKKSLVKRINFVGNKNVSSKTLRGVLLTKEDWILNFLDKAGTYHPDRISADKHMIELHYQNDGYLNARVVHVEQTIDEVTKQINLTFEIEEGGQFTIKEINIPGNDLMTEEQLLDGLPLKAGTIYSREKISNAIKALEFLWGSFGYIYAHVEPSIQPDNENNTVNIAFFCELGNKITLNKINIRGNYKTRNKVILRKVLLQEGQLLTNRLMEVSKNNVQSLGYFDPRDGVNWKIRRLTEETADLDLMLKETKTGNFYLQAGFGGAGADIRSPASGANVKIGLSDRNLFGSGIFLNFDTSWAKNEQSLILHVAQPWLFDKPISGAFDLYHKRPTYDNLRNIMPSAVSEKLTGGAGTLGVIPMTRNMLFFDIHILGTIGIDSLHYDSLPKAMLASEVARAQYQAILNREFVNGTFVWLSNNIEQDTRNHPIHTSHGHWLRLNSKLALPSISNTIGFYKLSLDFSWFTPIIGDQDLVFRFHTFLGVVNSLNNKTIPFGDLFHLGGPSSVRGYLFGQIGPQFEGDSIGGKKAMYVNSELIFPITPDLNLKGVLFYDGGSGFDNPHSSCIKTPLVTQNNFDYRHSVGFGLRMLSPMPVKVDWGFKLDPRPNESSHEVHFGMTYDW